MNKSTVSFPGLGIGEFEIDSVAFEIFGRPIAWYGLIIAVGMLLAVGYVMWRTREYKGICADDIIDFALFIIIFGVIGARLYYVIFSANSYDSFMEVIAIWEGGLGIYGGIIAGAVTAMVICRIKKIRIPCFLDMLAPAVMLAQAIGRWGNFCNGEAFGAQTDGFLRMGLISSNTRLDFGTTEMVFVHPTFLYESLWNLLGFILINIFYRKRKFDGQIVLSYLAWYGFGRMFIELLRTDSLYIGPLRVSTVVGLLSFLGAGGAMVYLWFIKKAKRYESASYKPLTEGANETEAASAPDTENTEKTSEDNENNAEEDAKLSTRDDESKP